MPEFWILPNHPHFSDFINKKFNKEAISNSLNEKTKLIKWIDDEQKIMTPFDHQWFVSNYLNDNTPYRGLLLYHGLGSGKSGASITIAEGFKNKKIVILTPASLKNNYKIEISKFGEMAYTKNYNWNYILHENYDNFLEKLGISQNNFDQLNKNKKKNKRGIWLIDIDKKPNYNELKKKEQKDLCNQINFLISKKYSIIGYDGSYSTIKYIFKLLPINIQKKILNKCNIKFKNKSKEKNIKKKDGKSPVVKGNKKEEKERKRKEKEEEKKKKAECKKLKKVYDPKTKECRDRKKRSPKKKMKQKAGATKEYKCNIFKNEDDIEINYESWSKNIMKVVNCFRFQSESIINKSNEWCNDWNPFNNKVIIIDEIHNLISSINSSSLFGNIIYQLILNAFDLKLVFLSGTPVRNNLYEFGLIYNLLKGKVPIYRIKNIKNLENDDLKNKLEENKYIEKVILRNDGKNNSIYFTRTPNKFQKTNKTSLSDPKNFEKYLVNSDSLGDSDTEINKKLFKIIKDDLNLDLEIEYLGKFSYFQKYIKAPHNLEKRKMNKKNVESINKSKKEFKDLVLNDNSYFKEIVQGTTSFYNEIYKKDDNGNKISLFPNVKLKEVNLPITYQILDQYIELRKIEQEKEEKSAKFNQIKSGDLKVTSLFKVYTRQASIFTFPKDISRPRKKIMSSELYKKYIEFLDIILDINENEMKFEDFMQKIKDNTYDINDLKLNVDIFNELIKKYNLGKGLLNNEKYINNLIKLDQEMVDSITNDKHKLEDIAKENPNEIEKELTKILKKSKIKDLLSKIRDSDAKYNEKLKKAVDRLDKKIKENKNFKLENWSPKYNRMLNLISKTPGLVLVYSSFRNVEGIQIFKKILNNNGYHEYDYNSKNKNFKKNDYVRYSYKEHKWGSYKIVNIDKKTNKIKIQNQDEEHEVDRKNIFKCSYLEWNTGDKGKKALEIFNHNDNKFGQNCLILLITKSGAEGLNLKNVRQVHLMEPYWNNSRRDQVIGRARRIGSHLSLPEDQRNVNVYNYILNISDEMIEEIKDNKKQTTKLSLATKKEYATVLSKDKWKTTDMQIIEIAKEKEKDINKLLKMVKETALDCDFNYESNKNTDAFSTYNDGLDCYNSLLGTKHVLDDFQVLKNMKKNKLKIKKDKYTSYLYNFLKNKEKLFFLIKSEDHENCEIFDGYFYYFHRLYNNLNIASNKKDIEYINEIYPFDLLNKHKYKQVGIFVNGKFKLDKSYENKYIFSGKEIQIKNSDNKQKIKLLDFYTFISRIINALELTINNEIDIKNVEYKKFETTIISNDQFKIVFNIIKDTFKKPNKLDKWIV